MILCIGLYVCKQITIEDLIANTQIKLIENHTMSVLYKFPIFYRDDPVWFGCNLLLGKELQNSFFCYEFQSCNFNYCASQRLKIAQAVQYGILQIQLDKNDVKTTLDTTSTRTRRQLYSSSAIVCKNSVFTPELQGAVFISTIKVVFQPQNSASTPDL